MAKSTLEKYYISEKFDKNRNITFNFKKANQKISGSFPDFKDAVSEFIRVSEKTKNETRVWFHRDGAYRGSVNIEKAQIILATLSKEKVANENVIEYLEKQELVDKPTVKKRTVTTIVEETIEQPVVAQTKTTPVPVAVSETKPASCDQAHAKRRQQKTFWTMFTILAVLIVINIILIALRIAKVY
ncbi:hypothetical protein OF364_01290 [Mycoplasma enhydrae]|uniref:hypothetical protein n=1 Tax=Mycoplasma enhydrae TaxID=2499220 RepID=UPI0021E6DF5F|nr:hypothetical protein [Mycoplasma enhydrae]MCV3753448.1 hypothetical protein [Mycoplasma enhydrae]